MAKQTTFEAKMARLEEIVASLESDGGELEASLKLFEEGVLLSKELTKTLADIKVKVEQLTENAKGEINTSSFNLEKED